MLRAPPRRFQDVEYNANEMSTPMVSLEPIGDMVNLPGGDIMDQRNSAKKMTPVQIHIARKAKRVIRAGATIGLRRSTQPKIVPEIVQEEQNLSPGEEATSEASNQPTHNFKR
ncbi:hypothetical protein GIB67_031456 [Kingdonia uniflora]|uniref:Uncharacterized protein n=1 Tax=Kingdonia uniflora TaxID=39325 RepID=A0A7J7MBG6_9MAGN|nr:hypothetical protein GIB67_031456 [Kingdonia uniflora]